jgi:hypothetical protein
MSQSRVLFLEAHAETSGVSFRIKNARNWIFTSPYAESGEDIPMVFITLSPKIWFVPEKFQIFVIPRKYSGPQASVTLPSLHGDNPS